MAQPKVFLGIGHGGRDPGAVANGFEEDDLNLAIGLACRDELIRHGVQVLTSRTKDEDDLLADVVAECNAFAPDLAADIHNNAGGGDGAEVYHSVNGGSKKLAQNILDGIKTTGQNSRGVKIKARPDGRDSYMFIRDTKAPAVIVECAFVDNAKDIQIIDTPAEQKAMGVAIAKGFLKTLGITYKEENSMATKKDNTPDKYAKAAVEKAVKSGVLKGTTDGDLKLHSPVTRQDFFVFLDRRGLLK